ncbi:MAG: 3-oxoacyl-[acyl-carrier protein] reductase [Clostridiales bacterium]|nr:3-oxoacyl-[acyl-carrier protein] reductase [Clostridiales bacterium]
MGKVAVVTGASRGIGRAIAIALAAKGCLVIVNYNRGEQEANAVVEEIKAAGGKAEAYGCDVSDFAACEQFVKEIQSRYQTIDIWVNNAGITKDGLIMRMSEEDFDRVMDINLKGCFNAIRFVSRIMMKQRSGRIINMSSVSGILGNVGQANYAASKAGIIGLTKACAKELASRNITVNAIAPGFIETDMTDALSQETKTATLSMIPMGHYGKASDVAAVAAFLASDEAAYITGQVISVDGGMS